GRRALFLRYALAQLDQRHVCASRIGGETWRYASKVFRVEFGVRIDFPREKACAQWTEGNEADLELLARRQHAVALRVARPEGILALDCRQRLHGVRTSYRLRARLRKSEVANLSSGD